MRTYSRLSSLLVLTFALSVALFTTVHAAPSTRTASPTPASISYEGNFLKTLERVPQAPQDWHPLRDRYGRYGMAVPAEWVEGTPPADQEGMLYSLVAGESTPRDNFSANVVISQTQAPSHFVMKPDMVTRLATQMATDMKDYKYVVRDKAFTQVDGVPCVIVGGTLEVDGKVLRNLQVRLVHRDVNYLITFTSLEKYYPQYEPLFARLVKTIAFEREQPGGSPTPRT